MVISLDTLRSSTIARPIARSEYARGVLYATAAGIALGTLGPISNVAYETGMGSPTFAALRATIGALALGLVIAVTRHRRVSLRRLARGDRLSLAITAVAQAALSLSLFAAYGAMAVAAVLAVYFSYPILVAAASIALGRERLTALRGVALLVALGGLSLVVLGGGAAARISVAGVGLAAIAASCQATYLVASRSGFTRVPALQATGVILTGAAGLLWLVALPFEILGGHAGGWIDQPMAWVAVGIAGVLGAAVAKVLMLRGVRRVGGTRAAVLMLVEPITGVLLAAVLLAQGVTALQVIGGVAVLGGALLAQRPAPAQRPAVVATG